MENLSVFESLLITVSNILNSPKVQYPLAIAFIAVGTITVFTIITQLILSYRKAKKEGKNISWLNILEDIKWTLYDYSERDQEYVMSLPRLIYFISAILIVYVVVADKPSMLSPLLGFNLSAMVSYTSKKYIETKESLKERTLEAVEHFKEFKEMMAEEDESISNRKATLED